ncbi:MAG: glycoside hydrolase family 13 protein [Runella sp.]
MEKHWWKEAVIYQIYPRSFKDSNADGIGDLKGIISQLDYLQTLGVDVLWLSPIFASPNADNGYDVSDYEAIMADFGTMQDFDELLAQVHKRHLKVILDLVVNHSSDEHRWFRQSRISKDNPYRDYYIWQPPRNGQPPNDWISFFSGSAWEFDPNTEEYYLHLFLKKQPDLNWENPRLRQEIYQMMRFWLDKGVDGFRMDVIPFLSKDTSFPPYPQGRFGDLSLYANGPRIHEFLHEMNSEVLQHYDCLTVGEGFGVSAEQANLYVGRSRQELQMIYHFDHAVPREEHRFLQPAAELSLVELKAIFDRWDEAIGQEGWQNIYFGNHDNPRVLSRFGHTGTHREASAKMLATLLLTLRGTPTIYQGDELGMTNCPFASVEEFDDVQVKNAYQALIVDTNRSHLTDTFLAAANRIARDHARTPMPWDDSAHAGFTTATQPWLKVNPNFTTINAKEAISRPDSIYHYYRQMLHLRKQHSVLVYGDYQNLTPQNPHVWAFVRNVENESVIVICHFSSEERFFSIPNFINLQQRLIGNYQTTIIRGNELQLQPYEAAVWKVKSAQDNEQDSA